MSSITTLTHKKFLVDRLTYEEKRDSIMTKLKWDKDKSDVVVSYKGVKRNKLLKKHRDFVKIKITPIGWNNLCFQNSTNTKKFDPKYEVECGYNLTACQCGGLVCGEPHFVNYKMVNGKKEYYDFTKDFNGDEYKCFVPDDELKDKLREKGPSSVLRDENIICYGKSRCKCGVNWGF